MSGTMHIAGFDQLDAYKLAQTLATLIFDCSTGFPSEEMHALTAQIRRSSRDVGAQIAQAWAKRRNQKHFISNLRDADGHQQETQHWVQVAKACGYVTEQQAGEMMAACKAVGRKINGLIFIADKMCKK